eukprot:TRINITY_DN7124_c0_g1_i1.p1 TRINITY_DN7124_c0_g1~~TRINITY_DN7124_c0_g1_i1.p1  ORF type:complete len:249 (-),score=45.23 TRINITY_DN7124_c0_g1_i1:79-723(-)
MVEENHKQSMERAPHRLEVAQGSVRSVPVKFSVRSGAGAPAAGAAELHGQEVLERHVIVGEGNTTERSVAALDTCREAQRRQLDKERELMVARWIHAVTGDEGAFKAAEDRLPLVEALSSGEALCDLVNAVWPGRIVGIQRSGARRRLANLDRFVQACGELGVEEANVPAPSDFAEGKPSRPVVRCIFALAGLVPPPPDYDGPRLVAARERRGT